MGCVGYLCIVITELVLINLTDSLFFFSKAIDISIGNTYLIIFVKKCVVVKQRLPIFQKTVFVEMLVYWIYIKKFKN